jgi:ParB/RepB/Spo0J family partition protein
MARQDAELQHISPKKIKQNPDNPRLVFREEDMNALLESIKEVGIKVPLSLYQEGQTYILIDGERRWKCAKRLNLDTIPAIVQRKPTELENLLMMFNIHNVRVDWDPMPMALKLKKVRELLEKDGQPTNPKTLAAVTGVSLASVRRALDLLGLPAKYQNLLLKEAEKPRNEQRVKADLFIEVYKSLHAIERHTPEVLETVSKTDYVDSMVNKYVGGVVDNVVHYREVSKIARAQLAGVDKQEVIPALIKLVKNKKYSIADAYRDTVQVAYERRDTITKLDGLSDKLSNLRTGTRLSPEMRKALQRLKFQIERLMG